MGSQAAPFLAFGLEHDPHAADHIYYGEERTGESLKGTRARTYSTGEDRRSLFKKNLNRIEERLPRRRGSHDEVTAVPRKFIVDVESTLATLIATEDTDNNMQITIEDAGPKVISLGTANSNGYNRFDVRGNYMISNLLQELTLAKFYGRKSIILDESRLNENPVSRLSRLIKTAFWDSLTRRIDGSVIEIVGNDPKDWTDDPRPRIYVPRNEPHLLDYYNKVSESRPEIRLEVIQLPEGPFSADYVKSLNNKPGILALDMMEVLNEATGKKELHGLPFVVPGGRFNELYGWDSYMESLGLLVSDKVSLAKSMVQQFCFCIKNYNKILNANRSYYLCRSQPPFLTDMALRVYEKIKHEEGALEFLRTAILSAIKEYHNVWMAEPRLDTVTGLSRYRPDGRGVPPETEASHFTHLLEPYAKKNGMTFETFVQAYNDGTVKEPELDEYFLHDRAVRESGHDTSYRLERVCADLATIDLNSLLYKYETDISRTILALFDNALVVPKEYCAEGMQPGHVETSALWDRRAKKRKLLIDKYLWNEEKGLYFDYNTKLKKQHAYETATCFWAMWAGVASPKQAAVLVQRGLPKFECLGGLVSGTEESRGAIGLDRPNRQWDYPYGWAPQQMLAWTGLQRYGFLEEAERLAYRWLFMVTKAFRDYNGIVVEKYDVTRPIDPHKVDAEYGNQGSDFKGVAREGFGWVNASYVYGLTLLTAHARRALGTLTTYETFNKATQIELDPDSEFTEDEV